MNSQRTPQFTVFGNLGADPETHTLKGRTVTQERYDIATDEVVVQEHTTDERQIHTASLAVNGRNEDGKDITRWHRLVDFGEHLANCHKGDRLKVTGFFRERTYLKDGETKSLRELIVTASEIQPKRLPASAPETARPAALKASSRRKAKSTRRTSSKSRPSKPVAPEPFDADEIPF
jgi:single-stranded DNA-binding protein